jgi:uncharacterized protein (TIGR02266 family)
LARGLQTIVAMSTNESLSESVSADHDDEERPSVRRLPVSGVHVSVVLGHSSEHLLWSDLTLDVTKGGVFVATFHPLAVGTTVHLLLMIEGDPLPIAAEGIVRWVTPHREDDDGAAGAGIQFTKIDAKSLDTLARFAREVRAPMMFELDDSMRAPSAARV